LLSTQLFEIDVNTARSAGNGHHQFRAVGRTVCGLKHLVTFRSGQGHRLFAQHATPACNALIVKGTCSGVGSVQGDNVRLSLGQHRVEVVIDRRVT
jgi:hypothetical protein